MQDAWDTVECLYDTWAPGAVFYSDKKVRQYSDIIICFKSHICIKSYLYFLLDSEVRGAVFHSDTSLHKERLLVLTICFWNTFSSFGVALVSWTKHACNSGTVQCESMNITFGLVNIFLPSLLGWQNTLAITMWRVGAGRDWLVTVWGRENGGKGTCHSLLDMPLTFPSSTVISTTE